jgi:hypothetical protein
MLIPSPWQGGVAALFFFLLASASQIGSLSLCRTCRSGPGVASYPSNKLLGVLLCIAVPISALVHRRLYLSSLAGHDPFGTSEMSDFRSYLANHQTAVSENN